MVALTGDGEREMNVGQNPGLQHGGLGMALILGSVSIQTSFRSEFGPGSSPHLSKTTFLPVAPHCARPG